jgi:hypothetical protein
MNFSPSRLKEAALVDGLIFAGKKNRASAGKSAIPLA